MEKNPSFYDDPDLPFKPYQETIKRYERMPLHHIVVLT